MVKEEYMKAFLYYHDHKRYEILIRIIENVIGNSLFTQRTDKEKVDEIFTILENFHKSKEVKPIYIIAPRSNKKAF